MNNSDLHTFVICAYGNSPYLEECIRSLQDQSVTTSVCLSTSTPSMFLQQMCEKYNIKYYVRDGKPSISDDWNYAISVADTPYVTIAHQDDIYLKDYAKWIINGIKKTGKEIGIIFTDCYELTGDRLDDKGINIKIKHILSRPLSDWRKSNVRWRKRFIIRFGNAIVCPSVTYNMMHINQLMKSENRQNLFASGLRSNLDWELWEWLSRRDCSYVYIHKPLICHRIHNESETTAVINGNIRSQEDYSIFRKFWPAPIAKIITKVYRLAEKENGKNTNK